MKKRIKIILLLILILTISVICKNSKSYAADTTVPITLDDSFENDNNNDEINMPLRGGYRFGIFCNQNGQPYDWEVLYGKGNDIKLLTTDGRAGYYEKTMKWQSESSGSSLPNMVGYAFYLADQMGVLESSYTSINDVHKALQDVIWAVVNDSLVDDNNGLVYPGRGVNHDQIDTGGSGSGAIIRSATREYTEVYYRILKHANDQNTNNKNKGSIFLTTAADDDGVKVFVNQKTGKYTVGPYIMQINPYISSLSINTSNVEDYNRAVRGLYNVLTNPYDIAARNFAKFDPIDSKNGFANFNALKNANGQYLDANGNPTIEFIDEEGNTIKFPNFSEKKKFYIRFTPANDGAICDLTTLHTDSGITNPSFKITYFSSFSGQWKKYKCKEQDITITGIDGLPTNNYEDFKNFLRANNISFHEDDGSANVRRFYRTDRPEDTSPFYDTVTVDIPAKLAWGLKGASHPVGEQFTVRIVYRFHHDAVVTGSEGVNNEYGIKRVPVYKKDENGKDTDEVDYYKWVTDYSNYLYTYGYHRYQSLSGSPASNIHYDGCTVLSPNGGNIIKTSAELSDIESGTQRHIVIRIGGGNGGNISMKTDTTTEYIPNATINMELQGTVWVDQKGATKESKYNGQMDNSEAKFPGIQVSLYEYGYSNGKYATERTQGDKLIATTTTDSNGKYWFFGRKPGTKEPLMNPLRQYYVVFKYNGQLYQDTYYMNDLSTDGKHSNAQELDNDRTNLNNRFGTIHSSNESYTGSSGTNRAFAYNSSADLSFSDYWKKFVQASTYTKSQVQDPSADDYYKEYDRQKTYDEVYSSLNGSELEEKAKQYVKDSMINAYTGTPTGEAKNNSTDRMARYPSYDKFVIYNINKNASTYKATGNSAAYTIGNDRFNFLYTYNWDQSRNVNFGLFVRQQNDLALQKDVYKATVMVNGQRHVYKYNKKSTERNEDGEDIWTVNVRASDALFNGSTVYNREVRASDYLLTSDTNAKNMQVYVTYRVAVKNLGTVDTKVDEIVDYFDNDNYEFDGTLNGNQYQIKERTDHTNNEYRFVQSYIGNKKGEQINNNLKVSNVSTTGIGTNQNQHKNITGGGTTYNSLYVSGITGEDGNEWLEPGKMAFVYLTFKVKTDPATGKPKLDQALTGNTFYAGKRNIAEVNTYSTRYTNGTTLPNYIASNGTLNDKDVSHQTAGIVDFNSNAGNFDSQDLTDGGRINYEKADGKQLFNPGTLKDEDDPTVKYKYVENDTDQAPNIRLIIGDDSNERSMSGYVFEDNRTKTVQNAMIGDGIDKNEIKINGVTLKLIELVQNVDGDGMSLGTYSGEREVVAQIFDTNARPVGTDTTRYYSGQGSSRVLYQENNPNSIFYIESEKLGEGNGKYSLNVVPAGNYYIEFAYGDTDQTALTGGNNSVNTITGRKGLNDKSYNGQDYKSTTYQVDVNQSGSYRGINGFTKVEQDYDPSDVTNKSKMYLYDISRAGAKTGVSDAKDSYYRRQANINYANTLKNHNSEVLDSFEKLGQIKDGESQKDLQDSLINELEANTYMEARTGVIDTEVEYNRTESETKKESENVYGGNSDSEQTYKITDIDLGLQERPRAQLMLNKQVTGIGVVLANGQTLFNTAQSANNLAFTEHAGHKYFKSGDYDAYRLFNVAVSMNSTGSPELIQGYIDDELMEGSQLTVHYKFTVKNVGEVDYADKQFYYTGKEDNASGNLVKTNPNVVVDYLTNEARYDQSLQVDGAEWVTATADDLVPSKAGKTDGSVDSGKIANDVVNHNYYDRLGTYNAILITQKLNKDLEPVCLGNDNSKSETTLTTSAILSSNGSGDNLVYNNLSEIVITTNTVGRRMQFSIAGNQKMADQSLGDNAAEGEFTSVDLVTPSEVDADSAQKIVFMPPTGANRNYLPMIIATVIAMGFVLAGAIVIRKRNK